MTGSGPGRTDILRRDLARFLKTCGFGVEELRTKIDIVRSEFADTHGYDPVEHAETWLTTPDSVLDEADPPLRVEDLGRDVAGIRLTCAVTADVYRVRDLLVARRDVRVIEARDYIKRAGPDGYRGLCLVVEVPVASTGRVRTVYVEVQIRTGVMESWESVATRLRTEFDGHVPREMLDEQRAAAESARDLDLRIGALQRHVEERSEADRDAPPA